MDQECVAVLLGLCKKNGAVLCIGIDFYLIWSFYLVRTWEGSSYTRIPSGTGFDCGQISIEIATYS